MKGVSKMKFRYRCHYGNIIEEEDTRGIWKVMYIDPYNFTQWSEKKDECISVNIRIWGFWGTMF